MKRFSDELEEGEELEDECVDSFNADDWDDSALIEAWDLAKNEYLKHHGLEQEKVKKKPKITNDDLFNQETTLPLNSDPIIETDSSVKEILESHVESKTEQENLESSQSDIKENKQSSEKISDLKDLQQPISPDQLNALMAWYWAGYYTAKLSK